MDDAYPAQGWNRLKSHNTDDPAWGGRGAHSLAKMMIYGDVARLAGMKDPENGTLCLWIVGGEGGVPEATSDEESYYQDVWFAQLPESYYDDPTSVDVHLRSFGGLGPGGSMWNYFNQTVGWAPRGGHVLAVEPSLLINNYQERMCLQGGKNEDGILDDTWCWGAVCLSQKIDGESGYNEDNRCVKWKMASEWVEDYTADAWYRYQTKNKIDNCLIFSSGAAPDYC